MSSKLIAETYYSEVRLDDNNTGTITKRFRHQHDPRTLVRFRDEVRSLKRVGAHPNINQLVASSELSLCITLTLAPGRVLTSYDSETLISHAHIICKQLTSALVHIRSCGLIHDDVKPTNIIVSLGTGAGEVVTTLVDFGACIEQGSFTPSGTPWYVAPEFIQRIKGPKTDVWALGITMAWVLGWISLPDEKNDEWILPRIWEDEEEMRKMKEWLECVEGVQKGLSLDHDQGCSSVVALMLEADRERRITCDRVVELLVLGVA